MEFHLVDFIQHIGNIVVLFLLLRALLFKPVRKFMLEREEKFTREREAVKAAQDEAQGFKAQYEAQLAAAREKAEELALSRAAAANEEAKRTAEQAQRDAQAVIENARKQAQAERQDVLRDLKEEAATLAVELAGRILSREVSEEDNRRIIDEYFQKVG